MVKGTTAAGKETTVLKQGAEYVDAKSLKMIKKRTKLFDRSKWRHGVSNET